MRRLARRLSVACLAVVLLLGMAAVSWNRAQDSGLSSSAPVTPPPPTAFLAIDVDSVDAAALDAAVVAGIIPAGAFQSPSTPEPQPTAVPSRKARGPVAGSVLALEPLAPTAARVRVTCPPAPSRSECGVPAAATPLLDTAGIPMYALNGHLVNELGEPWMVLQLVVPSYNASEADPSIAVAINATAYFGVPGDPARSATVHTQPAPSRTRRTMPLQPIPPDQFSSSHLHVVHRVKLPRAAVLEHARPSKRRPPPDAPRRFWAAVTITVDYTFLHAAGAAGTTPAPVPLSLQCEFVVPALALPDDCALDAFADLLLDAEDTQAPPAGLVLCLGPITAVGASLGHFWNYTVAYFEHHRRIGVARILFYFDGGNDDAHAVAAALAAAYVDDPLVEFVDTSALDRVARTTYQNQHVLLNHCLNRVKGPPRFVYACDLDEVLVATAAPGGVPGALAALWARRTAEQSQFAFTTADDHTVASDVCGEPGTFAEATARLLLRMQESSPLAALDYFVVNATCHTGAEVWCRSARRKTISLAAQTRILATHTSIGGAVGPGLASVGLAKVHARGLPFRPPTCTAWADAWLAAPESDGAARVHRDFFPPGYLHRELASKQPFFTL